MLLPHFFALTTFSSGDGQVNDAGPIENDYYIDLNDVHDRYHTSMPYHQDEVLNGVNEAGRGASSDHPSFPVFPPTPTPLSEFRAMYEYRHKHRSILSLPKYRRAVLNANYSIPSDDKVLSWGTKLSYIDALVLVPSNIGLDVLIPESDPGQSYTFALDFSHRGRQFVTKHAELGFNPTNSLMHIGYCGEELIWMALRPIEDEIDGRQLRYKRDNFQNTVMPVKLQHMLIMCLTHMLALKAILHIFVVGGNTYPDGIENWDVLKKASSLL